jgi:hypothetical protein
MFLRYEIKSTGQASVTRTSTQKCCTDANVSRSYSALVKKSVVFFETHSINPCKVEKILGVLLQKF